MSPMTTCGHMPRRRLGALALALAVGVLPSLGATDAQAAAGVRAATTPTFPAPASARPQSPSAGVTTSTATAATTPTTTFVPSGGAAAPGAAPNATTPSTTTSPAATTPATTTPPATTVQSTSGATPAQPTAKTSRGDGRLSTGALVIAVLAALLVLACATWALARRSAFEPHWLLSLRHAMAEAGFRASATWSEFADWARLGR
jgi:hypothetical protein